MSADRLTEQELTEMAAAYRCGVPEGYAYGDALRLLAEVERLHKLEVAVRYYHNGHGYIERSERWQAVRAILEGKE